jgi:hypothetical protein
VRSVNDLFIEFEDRILRFQKMFWDLVQIGVKANTQIRLLLFDLFEKLFPVHDLLKLPVKMQNRHETCWPSKNKKEQP